MTNHDGYGDDYLRAILRQTKTVAVVGASADPDRPSNLVMRYLQANGFRVIPVNPSLAGAMILGERAFAALKEVPVPVDLVDVFRVSGAAPEIVADAIGIRARAVWMQVGVRHDEAARRGEAAGLKIVMDRCVKTELSRLFG
ncbi:MAG TPA: CoA-binding protein [Candidatus Dormibacteraeota bacterium]|nr:CoA-binding protein [Candidatus Dormibacteraeota bacterium]